MTLYCVIYLIIRTTS